MFPLSMFPLVVPISPDADQLVTGARCGLDARCRPLHPDHRGTDMNRNGHNVAVVFPLEPELAAL